MESNSHFHFYSRVLIMLFLAVSLVVIQRSVETQAWPNPPGLSIIRGFAWADSIGWLSFNHNNDFNADGINEDGNGTVPYGLSITDISGTTYIQGCAWAGTPLIYGIRQCTQGVDKGKLCTLGTASTDCACKLVTLGSVCFSDPTGTNALSNGVTTSSNPLHPNALDENSANSYASILNEEFRYQCDGGSNKGLSCTVASQTTDCPGKNTCIDTLAWKLTFPIASPVLPADTDTINIEGCFNCYEVYTCSITKASCTVANQTKDCPPVGDPVTSQTCTLDETKCDNCLEYFYYQGHCSISATVCNNNAECLLGESCLAKYCSNNLEQACANNGECGVGTCDDIGEKPSSFKKVIGGYQCNKCTITPGGLNNTCDQSSERTNANSCSSCKSNYYQPGVILDHKHYRALVDETLMCGWAWNGWSNLLGDTYGLGWFQFSSRINTTISSYVRVEGGNIYSKKDIFSQNPPPAGQYNTAYIIEAGGSITNFISKSSIEGVYSGERPDVTPAVNFWTRAYNYENVLGTVDYDGLITVSSGNKNKFGSEIVFINNSASFQTQLTTPLNYKVIYYDGDLVLPSLTQVLAGGLGESGAGVVVIDGDFTINGPIVYDTDPPVIANLKQIPSIVWVVRGDVIIDTVVPSVAGTFIVLGNDKYNCSATPPTSRCGVFQTAIIGDPSSGGLKVYGNVLARRFLLYRQSNILDQPAETFINDGRLQANPPLGFIDFSQVIPRFSDNP